MGESYIQSQLELLKILPNSTSDEVFTGEGVALEIVTSLVSWIEPDIFKNPSSKFLDIYTKSGIFLLLLYEVLMENLADTIADESERSNHILSNMLYGISPSSELALVSRKTLYGNWSTVGNIKYLQGYKDKVKKDFKGMDKELGTMKFDVVIGNPPYNRGIDLDFVKLSYSLSSKYTCMITPAKWQTGETDTSLASKQINYEQFRQQLVPHMSNVVFYPNATELFDILGNTGITYFLLDKDRHEKCSVENRFSCFPEYYNSIEQREISNGKTLCNIGQKVIDCIDYSNGTFTYIRKNSSSKAWVAWGTAAMPMFLHYKPGSNIPHYMLADLKVENSKDLKLSNDSFIFFESDSKEECESFVSYVYTRLVRFLISCNIGLYKGWNKQATFKFVPAPTVLDAQGNRVPGKFDHIYTDQELYKTFNIPQKYIDVIEAIIKERKQ